MFGSHSYEPVLKSMLGNTFTTHVGSLFRSLSRKMDHLPTAPLSLNVTRTSGSSILQLALGVKHAEGKYL